MYAWAGGYQVRSAAGVDMSGAQIGDFVAGYGTVLRTENMAGGRLVVMENGTVFDEARD